MTAHAQARRGQVIAVLGPTNTGKTHLAMERLLAHRSGIMGFPLRLLARENYDRAVAARGRHQVALITGEEKIIPERARYFLCTVEAMPLGRPVDFLAVDEVQMCADADRGHVFTDRLLNARGMSETMFLGADTMRPIIRRLVPEAEFQSRPRFSTLTCTGPTKVNRLKPRSAVVAFTANDVYAIAELIRRQRGGAAVVLGALSPRTRNAQVAMYQDGDVDYLVATDAIGMGLNMDVDHVAFASLGKFDGRRHRDLTAAELAQTAGRAGRHTNDGTFGTTNEVGPLDQDVIDRIEGHRFDDVRRIFWRNPRLDYGSVDHLRASLQRPPADDALARVREADDERALAQLARSERVTQAARGRAAVGLLWEVCQIPDFEKQWGTGHAALLERIYDHLTGPEALLPEDWLDEQVSRVDRTDGDIEALMGRIARVRTWTYVSHKTAWLADAGHWQERAREIEDRLSDALHERLTQRFVDKRTTTLVNRMRGGGDLMAAVRADGDVLVEGHYVGYLRGLRFQPDETRSPADQRAVMGAALRVLGRELARRADRLAQDDDEAFAWRPDNSVAWHGEPVARVVRGDTLLVPRLRLKVDSLLDAPQRERVEKRLANWLRHRIHGVLAPLLALGAAEVRGPARGLVFQLGEAMGTLPRRAAEEQVSALTRADRQALRALGVRIGREVVYMPALLKPDAVAMRARLWAVWHGYPGAVPLPEPGRVTVALPDGLDRSQAGSLLATLGYRTIGNGDDPFAIRADMLERIAGKAWALARRKPAVLDETIMSLAGAGPGRAAAILRAIGFRVRAGDDGTVTFRAPKPPARQGRPAATDDKGKERKGRRGKPPARPRRRVDPDSPFAVLATLRSGE